MLNHMPDGPDPRLAPQARYILPSFVEHSSWGVKESNPYNKLFEERIIFLGVQVDDASANDIMAQLLVLESLDPDRDITMYINSPGGSFTSLMAIYDTMQYVRADIQTVCLGQAASAAAVAPSGTRCRATTAALMARTDHVTTTNRTLAARSQTSTMPTMRNGRQGIR